MNFSKYSQIHLIPKNEYQEEKKKSFGTRMLSDLQAEQGRLNLYSREESEHRESQGIV